MLESGDPVEGLCLRLGCLAAASVSTIGSAKGCRPNGRATRGGLRTSDAYVYYKTACEALNWPAMLGLQC